MAHLQFNRYALAMIASAAVAGTVAAYVWRRRPATGATPLVLMATAIAQWCLTSGLELASMDLASKVFWSRAQYLGIVAVPVLWFCFALAYTGRENRLTRRTLSLLAVVPAITLLLVWTNDAHGLIWNSIELNSDELLPMLELGHGAWFWIHTAYSYSMLLLGSILLVRAFTRAPHLYRGQAAALLIGAAMPWVANAAYVFGLWPMPFLDPTPFAFTIAGLATAWALLRYRLLDIVPVARHTVVDSMVDGVLVLDHQGRIVDINPAACRFLGCTARDAVGQPADRVLVDWPDLVERFRHAQEVQAELMLSAGQEQYCLNLRISEMYNNSGKATGKVIVLHDTTALKQAETALRESNLRLTDQNLELRKLTRAVEQSASTILITDLKGNIEYVNPAFSQISGYTRQEVIGRNPRLLKSGRHPPEMYKELWETINGGRVWQGELANRKKSGEIYWEAVTISPVADEAGRIRHFVAVKDDITLRKQAEEALARAHEQALEAGRLKTQLLANVSHDMRTPLNVILGRAEMLQGGVHGPLAKGQDTAVEAIINSTYLALAFVNNLLGQAQIESGRVVLNSQTFAPAELLETIQSTAGTMAQAKGLKLTGSVAPDLPSTLRGDPYWLKQILSNLVSNAVKFTERGTVDVRLFLADENHWAMQVSDTGCGIPASAQEYIFEPFRQADGMPSRLRSTGSGLGLSIVQQLTTLMGGQVKLTSEVEQGSTFTIYLPLDPSGE